MLRDRGALVAVSGLCGAAVGAGCFLLATVVRFGVGLTSSAAFVLYWRGPVVAGALFGGVCGIVLALRQMSWRWAGLAGAIAGAVIELARIARLASTGLFDKSPGALGPVLLSSTIAVAAAAGTALAAKGMADWLRAVAARGPEAVLNRGFAASAGVIAGIALFISGSIYYAQTLAPKRICVQFARGFVRRDQPVVLNALAYGFESNLTPDDAKLWLARLKRYLPTAGRAVLTDSYQRPNGMPEYEFAIEDGRFPVSPTQTGPQVGTFRVRALRIGPMEWRVAPAALPVRTYLSGLYGPEAGKNWLRFLREGQRP